jgi:hypothetical protein
MDHSRLVQEATLRTPLALSKSSYVEFDFDAHEQAGASNPVAAHQATPAPLQLLVPLLTQRLVGEGVYLLLFPTLEGYSITALQKRPDLFQAQPFPCLHADCQSPACPITPSRLISYEKRTPASGSSPMRKDYN